MDRTLSSPPRWGAPPAARRQALAPWRAALAGAWHRLTMDADERWLRGAHDLADLERRLRALECGGVAAPPRLDAWR